MKDRNLQHGSEGNEPGDIRNGNDGKDRPGGIYIIGLQRIIYTQPKSKETLHESKQTEQHPEYAKSYYNVNKKKGGKRSKVTHWGGHGMSVRTEVVPQSSCICLCQSETCRVTFPANSDRTPAQPTLAHVLGMW